MFLSRATRMPLDSSFLRSLRSVPPSPTHHGSRRASSETVPIVSHPLSLPHLPLFTRRPAVSPPFIESRRRRSPSAAGASLPHVPLPRPFILSSRWPEYLPFSQPSYIKFLRFFELRSLPRVAPSRSLSSSHPLAPSLASRVVPRDSRGARARDPGDNPVYLSDKRPINLFALSPTPPSYPPIPPPANPVPSSQHPYGSHALNPPPRAH